MKSNPYKILHIDQDANAIVIKAAYRALLKSPEGHPDIGGNEEYTKLLNEAYKCLSDPQKRKEIDLIYKNKQSDKSIEKHFIICLQCQTINRVDHINQAHYSRCAQCNNHFVESYQQKTKQNNEPRQKEKRSNQETVSEEFSLFLYNKRLFYRALTDYLKLIETNAPNAYLEYMAGMCYYRLGNYNDAIRYFSSAIKRDPDYLLAFYFLGRALMNNNQFADAINYFEKCTQTDNDERLSAIALTGCCYFSMAYYKKAIAEFNKVILKNPALEQSIYYLALCHYRRKEFYKAKSCFILSSKLFPKNNKIPQMIEHCERHLQLQRHKN